MGKIEIATALKTARNYRGLTQVDAAKATNLTYQAISNFERGTNRVESIALGKLCSLYKISVKSVLDCRDWDEDYVQDFLRAKSDDTRRDILRACGPCPKFICEYNDLLIFDDAQEPKDDGLTDIQRKYLAVIEKLSPAKQQEGLNFLVYLEKTQDP